VVGRRKILFVSHSPDLYGAERSLLLLLGGIDRSRFEPSLLVPEEGLLEEGAAALGVRVRRLSRKGIGPGRPLLGRAAYFPRLRSLMRRERPDLVYVNTSAHTAPLFAAKSLVTPCVVHVRESESYFNYRKLMGKVRIHALLNIPDRFIAVSAATGSLLLDRGVSSGKIVVVYNGVDVDSFRPEDDRRRSTRRQLGLGENDSLVGFVGQLIPRKGGDIFLQAARLVLDGHPESRFLIVGGPAGSEHHLSLVDLGRELGLEERLTFLEFQDDIRPFYDAMDLFVNCSRGEPFARVNLEAMAMAKAVVATDVGGNREAVANGECGYIVPPASPAALAERIGELIARPERRMAFGEAARVRVAERFTVARYRAGVGAVIDDLMRERN
jgi:glycosyltransferase involved in cell wall biosynthesis